MPFYESLALEVLASQEQFDYEARQTSFEAMAAGMGLPSKSMIEVLVGQGKVSRHI